MDFGPRSGSSNPTIWLKQESALTPIVRNLIGPMMASLMLLGMFAGCLGSTSNEEMGEHVVVYATTNATIVEVWEDGDLVETQYPLLTFDFSESRAPAPFVLHSVKGEHAFGTVDATDSSLVEVEFDRHGFHLLELISDYGSSTENSEQASLYRSEVLIRVEKRIEWTDSSTNDPEPMVLDTRREIGDEPASVIVIESTVYNPQLINNIGGGQDVDVSWQLIDATQEACQSQPGTVEEGGSASWKTVHFNTDEVHELRVTYEEGQDAIDVVQIIQIQYEALETPANA
jgi:hypothetical protein